MSQEVAAYKVGRMGYGINLHNSDIAEPCERTAG